MAHNEWLNKPVARRDNMWKRIQGNPKIFVWILLAPVLLFFVVFNVIPTLWMIGLSFYRYTLTSPNPPAFFGFRNFFMVLPDDATWSALSKSFLFVICGVSLQTVLGLLLGFLFWHSAKMPGRRLALTLLFSPMIMAPVAVGNYFKLMLNPIFGVINYIAKLITGSTYDFLGNPSLAFPTVLLVDVWMWTPFMILMTLAALASVPKAEMEAASVDRLTFWQKFKYVLLPNGKFIIMLGILLRTIDSFKTMDLVFTMTTGGPGNATEFIGIAIYRRAFAAFTMGSASTLALVTLLIAIAFTAIYLYVLKTKERQAILK